MKVKIGDSVKNIPKRFSDGVFLIEESQLETPLRVRLTPFERFAFAEATWRYNLNTFAQKYLNDFVPTHASVQINRSGDKRYIVHYNGDGMHALALVPKKVYNKCPNELRTKQYVEF